MKIRCNMCGDYLFVVDNKYAVDGWAHKNNGNCADPVPVEAKLFDKINNTFGEGKVERRIPVSFTDIRAGIRHDYNTAKKEGFKGVAERAGDLLNQIDKVECAFRDLDILNYKTEIVFTEVK